jgi:two-component system phosphate regulon sensor histidine kinase PhoR
MSPIKGSCGVVTRFIGIQHDISDKKKAEQQLRQPQVQMEKEIQEQTKSLKDSEAFLTSIVHTVRESLWS